MTQNTLPCALGRNRCTPKNLTEAVHCVARHSGVDAHQLADTLGCDYATFIRWTEPNGLCQMPGRKFGALAIATGRFDHLTWVAADAGLVVARRIAGNGGADRVKELLDIAEQTGRLAAADRDASVGGWTEDEKQAQREILQRICREVSEYEQALA